MTNKLTISDFFAISAEYLCSICWGIKSLKGLKDTKCVTNTLATSTVSSVCKLWQSSTDGKKVYNGNFRMSMGDFLGLSSATTRSFTAIK